MNTHVHRKDRTWLPLKLEQGGPVRKESSRVIGVTSGPSEAQMLSESPRVHEGGRLGRRLLL